MRSPLQLEVYDFHKVSLLANEGFDRENQPPDNVKLGIQTSSNEDLTRWRIVLDITSVTDEDEPVPAYEIDLRCVGIFKAINPEGDKDDIAKIVMVNGGSILYSAAREYLLGVTARAMWGPFMLPTVSLAALAMDRHEELKQDQTQAEQQEGASP